MSDSRETAKARFDELLALCRTLRSPDGCPWDRAQSVRTLGRYLVEEAFEALHASRGENPKEDLPAELGDLAFVLALTMVVAESEGIATPESMMRGAVEKIRRRHPHVFDTKAELTEREAALEWEDRKERESGTRSPAGRLRAPDPAQPSLHQARELQERAAAVGFDWPNAAPVLDKLHEELAELEEAIESPERRAEEFGDLLFAAVNLARFLDVDPEASLRKANEKFRTRFNRMVDLVEHAGSRPEALSLEELDRYWDEVKRRESGS